MKTKVNRKTRNLKGGKRNAKCFDLISGKSKQPKREEELSGKRMNGEVRNE